MSPRSSDDTFPPSLVTVIDTSALIEFKRIVKIDHQWDLLASMRELVDSGAVAFPRQVAKELAQGQHPDAPGAWIASAKGLMRHPQPTEETLVKVLAVAPQLIDYETTADREVADPYVVAMAYEVAAVDAGCRVVVVTTDIVDRLPAKLSLRTACQRMGIEVWSPADFISWLEGGWA